MEDITEVVRHVLENYLPLSKAAPHLDEATGFEFKLKRALRNGSQTDFHNVLAEYNEVIEKAKADGSIAAVLDKTKGLSLRWVERILDQVYARTVGHRVESLSKYKAFSDNTYGELKPQFASQIFRDTGISSSSVFLDLGSGIGNVALQAALEVGCESYGIEVMENPSQLAEAQAKEFPARCRLWGLSVGSVDLWKGDFLEDTRLASILERADVVLVNNQAFNPDLNEQLIQRFLDLKEGARIVSLKSFVPHGWKLDERRRGSIIATLEVQQKEYWSGCVSWKGEGGEYYVATKDSGRIERILGKEGSRRTTV